MKLITNGHWQNTLIMKDNEIIPGIIKVKINVLGKKYIIEVFGKTINDIPYGIYGQIEIEQYYLDCKNELKTKIIKYDNVLIINNIGNAFIKSDNR